MLNEKEKKPQLMNNSISQLVGRENISRDIVFFSHQARVRKPSNGTLRERFSEAIEWGAGSLNGCWGFERKPVSGNTCCQLRVCK